MVAADRLRAIGHVGEGVAVRGQHDRHAFELGHAVERREELREGVFRGADAVDVRRDRGQHVITRQEHAFRGIEEAEVVGCVAGRVHRHPLAAGQRDDLGVFDTTRGPRRREEVVLAHLLEPRPAVGIGHVLVAAPRSGPPGIRRGVLEGGLVLSRIPPGAERLVRDQLRAGLGPHPPGTAEVIGMRMGDHDRVDPLQPGA